MKITKSFVSSSRWKEWYTPKCTFYVGYLPKGDIRLGAQIGNIQSSFDLFVITFGFDRA